MADCTSSSILSHGTSKVSGHVLDLLTEWMALLEMPGDDADEELDSADGEEQDWTGPQATVCIVSRGENWRSSNCSSFCNTYDYEIKNITYLNVSHMHENLEDKSI